jgi:hypothetical protein
MASFLFLLGSLLAGCSGHRRRGIIALGSSPLLYPSRGVFKEIPRRNDGK